MGSYKPCTHPRPLTHTHNQPKKGHTHPHQLTPSQKMVTLTQTQPKKGHTHPHPAKKRSHSPTPSQKRSHFPTPTHTQYKKGHPHPHPPTLNYKKGHILPQLPTPSQKKVTLTHNQQVSSFLKKIDLLIFFYWVLLKQHLNLLFVCLFSTIS